MRQNVERCRIRDPESETFLQDKLALSLSVRNVWRSPILTTWFEVSSDMTEFGASWASAFAACVSSVGQTAGWAGKFGHSELQIGLVPLPKVNVQQLWFWMFLVKHGRDATCQILGYIKRMQSVCLLVSSKFVHSNSFLGLLILFDFGTAYSYQLDEQLKGIVQPPPTNCI